MLDIESMNISVSLIIHVFYHVEKARVIDPFGDAGFDPSGKIRLTP